MDRSFIPSRPAPLIPTETYEPCRSEPSETAVGTLRPATPTLTPTLSVKRTPAPGCGVSVISDDSDSESTTLPGGPCSTLPASPADACGVPLSSSPSSSSRSSRPATSPSPSSLSSPSPSPSPSSSSSPSSKSSSAASSPSSSSSQTSDSAVPWESSPTSPATASSRLSISSTSSFGSSSCQPRHSTYPRRHTHTHTHIHTRHHTQRSAHTHTHTRPHQYTDGPASALSVPTSLGPGILDPRPRHSLLADLEVIFGKRLEFPVLRNLLARSAKTKTKTQMQTQQQTRGTRGATAIKSEKRRGFGAVRIGREMPRVERDGKTEETATRLAETVEEEAQQAEDELVRWTRWAQQSSAGVGLDGVVVIDKEDDDRWCPTRTRTRTRTTTLSDSLSRAVKLEGRDGYWI